MAYDEDGQRHLHSTGCTTCTQALDEVARRYSTNSLIKGYSQQTPPSFGVYAESWWTDDCEYVKAEKDSGRELTKGYISIQRGSLERYLLPAFGKKKLEAIKVPIIEKWQRSLLDGTAPVKIPERAVGKSSKQKPLSPKYVNNLTNLLSTCSKKPSARDTSKRILVRISEASAIIPRLEVWLLQQRRKKSFLRKPGTVIL